MATYTFETITAAQAKAFDSHVDTLVFSNPTTTAATLRVNFSAATPITQTTLTVLDVADNHQVLFGAGLENLHAVLPDGSMLLVGGAAGSELTGGPQGDGIFGTGGADTLHGGAGDDVIQGGAGADVLEGGAGSDLFLFAPGESPPTLSLMDRIIDWSPADRLTFVFANGMLTPSANANNYVELTAQSFSAAATMAQAQMAGGVVEYVSVQVGADVIVFTDSGFHSPQEAVMLQGRTLADIDASNIVSGVAAPQLGLALGPPTSPPPPPPASATLNGGPGPDSISGGPENDLIFGRGGADTLAGGGGADTFTIGLGESPTSAAANGHIENLVRITDFTHLDQLVFVGEPAGTSTNFIGEVPLQADDFDAALSLANDLFRQRPELAFIEVQIGSDLVVIDSHHDAVVLSNQTFNTFNLTDIGDGGPLPPPPPPPGSPPAVHLETLNGGSGPDSISGGPENDDIFGRGGADTLAGGGGADTFTIGLGESSILGAAQNHIEDLVRITDFSSQDLLVFVGEPAGSATNFGGIQAASLSSALSQANFFFLNHPEMIFIDVEIGSDLVIIDSHHDAVVLSNQTLSTFHFSNIGDGTTSVTEVVAGDVDLTQLANLLDDGTASFSSTALSVVSGGSSATLTGLGFALDNQGDLTGGTITGVDFNIAGGAHAHITGLALPVQTLLAAAAAEDPETLRSEIFNGNDSIVGESNSEFIRGYGGNDTIQGIGGNAILEGDGGDDSLSGGAGGGDSLDGGFGADTMAGGGGADVFAFGGDDSEFDLALVGGLHRLDHVVDWNAGDFLSFINGAVATPNTYTEITAASYGAAWSAANANLANGIEYTVAQVGSDLVVFDLKQNDAIVIDGRTLADISQQNVGGDPRLAQPAPPPPASGSATAGNDMLSGHTGGGDTIDGLAGDDTISAGGPASNFLRGSDGNDSIQGGSGFDDINGNKGNDTIDGGSGGSDWLVGGQSNDLITAHAGDNIILGNLGNDTLVSGSGADVVRGGQGDDSLVGGSGADFISGDRGNDTESGGGGADIFHGSQDAGIDRVLDFHLSEGDRVQLDPGTTFTVHQVGADTVIDMGPSSDGSPNEMILVGVQASSLPPGTIFLG